MRTSFEKALSFCLKWEGGYTNDPDDPGGETNFGINKRDHQQEDIKNMTRQRAAEIYLAQYWKPVGADEMASPEDVVAFDAAVNCGVTRSRRWMKTNNWRNAIALRKMYYQDLAAAKPRLAKFLKGWLNRVRDLEKLCAEIEAK